MHPSPEHREVADKPPYPCFIDTPGCLFAAGQRQPALFPTEAGSIPLEQHQQLFLVPACHGHGIVGESGGKFGVWTVFPGRPHTHICAAATCTSKMNTAVERNINININIPWHYKIVLLLLVIVSIYGLLPPAQKLPSTRKLG